MVFFVCFGRKKCLIVEKRNDQDDEVSSESDPIDQFVIRGELSLPNPKAEAGCKGGGLKIFLYSMLLHEKNTVRCAVNIGVAAVYLEGREQDSILV